jgi:hypothetical protein
MTYQLLISRKTLGFLEPATASVSPAVNIDDNIV